MNRLFPEFPHLPKGAHIHAMEFELPDSLDDLGPSISSLCSVFHEACLDHETPLASIMYGFVAPEGAVPYLCAKLAERFGVDESRMGIAVLCTMGASFVALELTRTRESLGGKCLAENIKLEWFKEHRDEHSFAFVCATMDDDLTCDCPACLMFWAGRQTVLCRDKEDMRASIDKLTDFLSEDHERHGPGCVKHLIKGGAGEWTQLEDIDYDA